MWSRHSHPDSRANIRQLENLSFNILFLAPAKASLFERITLCINQELIKATPGHEIVAPGSARKSYNRELYFLSALALGLCLLNIRLA